MTTPSPTTDITIVSAFFDIGRGDISTTDYPGYLCRTNDTYFTYFKHLATLNNPMVIFSSREFKERILAIRQDKPPRWLCLIFRTN